MAINKVEYGGNTLIDITDTTATESDVLNGKTFYAANGTKQTGNVVVPTKTSDLTNDSGFIDNTVSDLVNYTTTIAMNTLLDGKFNYYTLSSTSRIWDLEEGVYTTDADIQIYYYGDTDTTNRISVTKGSLIFIADGSTTRRAGFSKTFLIVTYWQNDEKVYVGHSTSSDGNYYEGLTTEDIVNNLTTTTTGKTLDASQGKALKDLIDAIVVPTKVSELTNDSGFIDSNYHDSTKQNVLTFDTTPTSGSTNPVTSGGIYSDLYNNYIKYSSWDTNAGIYNITNKSNVAKIPTLDSNDKIKSTRLPTASTITNDANTVARTDAVYNALSSKADTSDLPTKVSDLTNDAGYITSSALSGYATTSDLSGVQDQVDANSDNIISNSNKIGTLSDLDTTDKTDLVSAVNEVKSEIPSDSGWINLSHNKGTWSYLRYRKIGNIVEIEGHASAYAHAGSGGETIVTLPVGYRPPNTMYVYGFTAGARISRWFIGNNGQLGIDWVVNISNGSNYTSSNWQHINVTYMVND